MCNDDVQKKIIITLYVCNSTVYQAFLITLVFIQC